MSPRALRRILEGLVAALACLVVFSCTPEEKHQVMTFFFDGVPPLHPPEPQGKPGSKLPPDVAGGTPATPPEVTRVAWYDHEPTLDKNKCGACHDRDASFQLLKPIEDLCVGCHEDKTREFPRMHGPAAIGQCGTCHEAHRSPYEHVVIAPPEKLCFRCHERTPESGQTLGCARDSDDARCTECHNPHGGSRRFFVVARSADVPQADEAPSPSPTEDR